MSNVEDFYNQSLVLNQEAFKAGLFDIAYHALMCALHSTKLMESDQPLLNVSKIATEQLSWIDENHPEYEHSTSSAAKRHKGSNIYSNLSQQAMTTIKMRQIRRE